MKRRYIYIIIGVLVCIAIYVGVEVRMQNKQEYVLENISSYISEEENPVKEIHVGDVLLDQGYLIELLPERYDFGKKKEKIKVTNQPIKESNRLLRIKALNDDGAVIAILYQDTYWEDEKTVVRTETEVLREVAYGEPFTVYSKYVVYDLPEQPSYTFVIYKEGERIINDTRSTKEPKTEIKPAGEGPYYYRCHDCNYEMTDTELRKYCPDCGSPFEEGDIKDIPWE